MAKILKAKPTSPGRRGVVTIKTEGLSRKRKIKKSLSSPKNRISGRSSSGRISVRRRGGGHKKHLRTIDWKRNDKDGIVAKVKDIQYDPNRSAHLALVCYADGEYRYILAPKGLLIGDEVHSGVDAPIKPGSCMPLQNIPLGSTIYALELKPGKGAQLIRGAGTSATLAGREGLYAIVKLRSGEMRRILVDCRACIGEVSNSEHALRSLGKAGASRWRGRRPRVRGVAMNPVDHPHGGGEGRTSGGRHPVSPTGVPAKGYKTRKNKRTNKMIIRDRRKK